jgi:hypothetical protein
MTPQKLRPTLRDCFAATRTIVRQTAGIAAQCVHVAAVETTAATGRGLARTADSLLKVRQAMGARFQYTSPKLQAPAKVHP